MVTDPLTLSEGKVPAVIQNPERGVQVVEHKRLVALLRQVNWSDISLFRAIAAAPSLRRAVDTTGLSVNTLRARLERVERVLETTLFSRGRDGLRITAAGETVLEIAAAMEQATSGLPLGLGNHVLVRNGEIRICVSEGIGTFWLTQRLPELKDRLPDLTVVLDCYSDQTRIRPDQYDLAVGFDRPTDPDLIVTRLATVHMTPFASDSYLREFGVPASLDDLDGHKCIQQDAPGLHYDSMRYFITEEKLRRLVTIRVSSSYSLYWAVATGVGMGVLPTYMRAVSKRLIPVDLPVAMKFELWLSYGSAARESAPVREAINWLRNGFDCARYPWFGERFVHPDAFVPAFSDSQVVSLFDHLIDDPAG